MSEAKLVDVIGRMRSPAATPGHWAGCAPPNKGQRYPADPPTVEEIILVMREAGLGRYADRTRALIAILWRAGLRISEALALTETDLDPKTGSVLVRVGKGGLCRIRHSLPYVAPGTMLRAGAGRRPGLMGGPWFGGSLP
jgi:integrase